MTRANDIGASASSGGMMSEETVGVAGLVERIAALEAEIAELQAYVPMLARLAYFERWGGSIPSKLLKLEDWTHLDMEAVKDSAEPHFDRPASEVLPAADALRLEHERWEMSAEYDRFTRDRGLAQTMEALS